MKGGNTYNITILSLHIENPQALPQTCLSPPGVSAPSRYQPWQVSQPPWSVPLAHLSSLPCASHSAAAAWRQNCSHRLWSWESSPTTSPWQRSYRKASPPLTQMKRGHKCQQSQHSPLPFLLNFLLKVTAVHSSYFLFQNTFHRLMDGKAI